VLLPGGVGLPLGRASPLCRNNARASASVLASVTIVMFHAFGLVQPWHNQFPEIPTGRAGPRGCNFPGHRSAGRDATKNRRTRWHGGPLVKQVKGISYMRFATQVHQRPAMGHVLPQLEIGNRLSCARNYRLCPVICPEFMGGRNRATWRSGSLPPDPFDHDLPQARTALRWCSLNSFTKAGQRLPLISFFQSRNHVAFVPSPPLLIQRFFALGADAALF